MTSKCTPLVGASLARARHAKPQKPHKRNTKRIQPPLLCSSMKGKKCQKYPMGKYGQMACGATRWKNVYCLCGAISFCVVLSQTVSLLPCSNLWYVEVQTAHSVGLAVGFDLRCFCSPLYTVRFSFPLFSHMTYSCSAVGSNVENRCYTCERQVTNSYALTLCPTVPIIVLPHR